jgi:secretion/DNA translocation related TadE-like protein
VSTRDDRGVATVYACLGVVVLLVLVGFAARLGAAVLARQRAEIGADLAALAGAARVLQGPDLACAAAVRVAVANAVAMESCLVRGTDVLVTVEAAAGTGPLAAVAAGRARAGPVLPIGRAAEGRMP